MSATETKRMHFRDIPQYPYMGNGVHVDLDQLLEHVARYEDRYSFTTDPVYQRGHKWTMEQRERFVEHILMGGQVGREILINCRNFTGQRDGDDAGPAEVLDGKQRLTSLLMFLRGEVRAFGRLVSEFEGVPRSSIIWRVVDFDELEAMRTYVMLNAGGTVHEHEEIQRVVDMIKIKEAEIAAK